MDCSWNLRQVAIRLEERFLNDIFSVLAILRNVLCNAENVAIIAPDQFFKRLIVAALGTPDQLHFFADRLLYVGLDGTHS